MRDLKALADTPVASPSEASYRWLVTCIWLANRALCELRQKWLPLGLDIVGASLAVTLGIAKYRSRAGVRALVSIPVAAAVALLLYESRAGPDVDFWASIGAGTIALLLVELLSRKATG